MQDRYKELWERLSEKNCSLETLERMIDGVYKEANQSFRYTDCCRSLENERNSLLAWRCPNWYKKRKIDELERVPTGKGTVPLQICGAPIFGAHR